MRDKPDSVEPASGERECPACGGCRMSDLIGLEPCLTCGGTGRLPAVSEPAERATECEPSDLARVAEWTHQYGANLCPGSHADTFGEGMRVAKEQIAAIIRAKPTEPAPCAGGTPARPDEIKTCPFCAAPLMLDEDVCHSCSAPQPERAVDADLVGLFGPETSKAIMECRDAFRAAEPAPTPVEWCWSGCDPDDDVGPIGPYGSREETIREAQTDPNRPESGEILVGHVKRLRAQDYTGGAASAELLAEVIADEMQGDHNIDSNDIKLKPGAADALRYALKAWAREWLTCDAWVMDEASMEKVRL